MEEKDKQLYNEIEVLLDQVDAKIDDMRQDTFIATKMKTNLLQVRLELLEYLLGLGL